MTIRPPAVRPDRPGARRAPVDWRRYATQVHEAEGRLPRYGHPLLLTFAASIVFTVAGVLLLQTVGIGLGAGIAGLGRSVLGALPQPTQADLVLGDAPVNVAAAPIIDPLPDFTKTPQVALSGRIPVFGVAPARKVVVALNGSVATTATLAADGRFGPIALSLFDGSNSIKATLIDGPTEIASTSATVVLQRMPPSLSIARPKAGDTITGTEVVVEGTTAPGSSVILNDRVLRPNPDGSFTDRIAAASPGPLAITIVATDRAGNETKTRIDVTVRASASPAPVGTTLAITLDRTTVRPGETVVAQIVATDGGKPKADVAVTLQVGVIPIGTYKTDATGTARIGFAAPDHEVSAAAVLVLGAGTSATSTLTVSSAKPSASP